MKVTIVKIDNLVIIDLHPIVFDLSKFTFEKKFHALQWDGDIGEVEYTDNKQNKIINTLDDYQPVIDEYYTIKDEQENQPKPTPEDKYNEMIIKRNKVLTDSDWLILRHKDQLETGINPVLTPESYKETLEWRQQLRDIPENIKQKSIEKSLLNNFNFQKKLAIKFEWPPIPDEIAPDFPDYPPDI